MTQDSLPGGPSADTVSAALMSSWAVLCSTIDRAWVRMADGVTATVTGIPAAPFNGVWVTGGGEVKAAEIETAVESVTATGLPYNLQARPANADVAAGVAHRLGMRAEPVIPVMATARSLRPAAADGFVVRALGPDEGALHCQLAGQAFGFAPELIAPMLSPAAMRIPGLNAYVGEVSGHPVATAVSLTRGPWAGIFNVSVPSEHQRRGYGALITAHAAQGAQWAWLQSSPAGLGIYQRLGFATLERWRCWVSPSPA